MQRGRTVTPSNKRNKSLWLPLHGKPRCWQSPVAWWGWRLRPPVYPASLWGYCHTGVKTDTRANVTLCQEIRILDRERPRKIHQNTVRSTLGYVNRTAYRLRCILLYLNRFNPKKLRGLHWNLAHLDKSAHLWKAHKLRKSMHRPALVEQCVSEVLDTLQQEAQAERPRLWQIVVVCSRIMSRIKAVQRNDVFCISLSPVEKLQV